MSLETPRDLFIHELSDCLSAEHIMLKVNVEMAGETDSDDARKAIEQHLKETEGQIERLNKIFELLGEQPEETTCPAAEGLKKEHDDLKEEKPQGVVKELGLLAGANKGEHYEIATYLSLRQMAQDLGEREIADLLNESLQEEKEMSRTVQSLAADLGSSLKDEAKAEAAR
jgi:ferritin-like metal-binding protein YciE